VNFQIEKWSDVLPELLPMFNALWAEVAIDKDFFVAECGQDKYKALENLNMLHLVTARCDKTLAGFFLMFLTPNAHYQSAGLMAFTDMYFLKPEYRRGNIGIRMFSFMEKTLREKGVVKAYTSHKLLHDRGPMLKLLVWTPSDLVYRKVLCK